MTSRDALVCVNSSCAMCTYYRFILRGEYIHTKIDLTFIILDARLKTKEDDTIFRVRVLII